MSYHSQSTVPALATSVPQAPSLPIYDATRMVGEQSTALLVLGDKTYTLRITRAGKLILTK